MVGPKQHVIWMGTEQTLGFGSENSATPSHSRADSCEKEPACCNPSPHSRAEKLEWV